ncbi:hypothetical protein TUMEXPCC7403_25275 [Tumidithrix helvetica PCC 7403]|uniref:hypothetical protein n=1 Tax=Tumidithrix helvetica TaxID=3457545 RepID=UPI003C91E8CF
MSKPKSTKNIFEDVFGTDESVEPVAPIVSESPSFPTKPVGRPKAKKSSPDHRPASAYIEKSVDKAVRIKLIELEDEYGFRPEFSDLVNDLLKCWLEIQNGETPDICWSRFSDRQNTERLKG